MIPDESIDVRVRIDGSIYTLTDDFFVEEPTFDLDQSSLIVARLGH